MFNPAKGAKNIKEDFIDYITTTLHFNDEGNGQNSLYAKFRNELERVVAKGPYVDINCAFSKGKSINQLIDEGILSTEFRDLEINKPKDYKRELPLDRPLYLHQENAIRILNNKNNAVITTGTGSGKTECFLIPMIDALLKEGEGLKEPGVRAILIYPMNALANDQMKRLRNILMKYPQIKFGVYNGDTPYDGDQSDWYRELHSNENYEELRKGLSNELLTREQMASNPPHILCTNYAMLEYMLLTPNRGAVFANSKVKFIILDEAHTYSGATGMETSLLIRRLIARICGNGNKPQYVLTSATLGKKGYSEYDINKFAENLTGEKFGINNIVFGERDTSFDAKIFIDYPLAVFDEIANNDADSNKDIFEKYNIIYDINVDDKENLYNLCSSSILYKKLRDNYLVPSTLSDISNWLGLNEKETVNFLHVCTLGFKNGSSLVDMRFHFFVRALEGLYHSLTGNQELFLERKEYIKHNGVDEKVFEISICKNCGDIAIVGHIENQNGKEYLLNRENKLFDIFQQPGFYHIVSSDELGLDGSDIDIQEADEHDVEIEDNDEEEGKTPTPNSPLDNKTFVEYWLCPHCGEISEVSEGKPDCGHDESHFIKLRKFSDKYKGAKDKCLKCFSGSYNRFYIGTEAATSVLATSLFEQLPIKTIKKDDEAGNEQLFEAGKQFLSFSDSRSEAAFFASYLDKTYEYMLGKRGLITVLEKNKKKIIDSEPDEYTLDEFASKLAKLFKENQTYNEDLLKDANPRELNKLSRKAAWTIIVKELISCKRNNSLQSLGFLTYKYLGNNSKIVSHYKTKYLSDLSDDEVKSFLDELAMTFAYFGALIIPEEEFEIELNDEDRRNIFWSSYTKGIAEQKTSFAMSYYGNWLPMKYENDPTKYHKTYRQALTLRALGKSASNATADDLLKEYFAFLVSPTNPYRALPIEKNNKYYAMPTDRFTIRIPECEDVKWFRCKKCGKITNINIRNKCSVMNCDGDLEPISDIKGIFGRNHYIDFYRNEEGTKYLRKIIIKEHTAQLSKLDAAEYQTKFEKNNINALSCSTTFEMGVDVGELETVFLRDIPPSAANYAQRAGRAGRSKSSAAFVMSYAKLSSHDFHYYDNPIEIICGTINPPSFKLDNPKIVFRHIYSTIFGYFFNKYPSFFEDNKGKQRDINHFFNDGGFDQLKDVIINPPSDLIEVLQDSFADLDDEFGISTFSGEWVFELIGPDGRLTSAEKEYRQTLKDFDDQIAQFELSGKIGGDLVKKRKNWYNATSLIDFLVDNNIIPKYGFPVDTVELKIGGDEEAEKAGWQRNSNKGLRLSRDMSQAISDYAPGCKVIANNKMYTPRYISKYWKSGENDFDHVFVAYCGNPDCRTLNASPVKDPINYHCKGCGESMNGATWEEAICPSAGMITDGKKAEAVPLKKPKKIYRSDYYFLERDNESAKTTLDVGGHKITVISSKKDEIIVTSSKGEPFYVCPSCGFTYGHFDRIKKKDGKTDTEAMKILKFGTADHMTPKVPHLRPTGAVCSCKNLYKKHLYHSFVTDIVQIAFNDRMGISPNTAISLMFALIKAAELKLGVEKNEISGVLRYDSTSYNTNYRFILFDNVPGGAGHVKRLVDSFNGYENLKSVLMEAYKNTKNCECDEHASCYKCLRTYENQKYHDVLSRIDVADFLKIYIGHNISEHKDAEVTIKNKGTKFIYSDWRSLFDTLPGMLSPLAETLLESNDIKLPDALFASISGDGIDDAIQPSLCWLDKKIFVFDQSQRSYVDSITNSDELRLFVGDDNLDILKLIDLLK